MPRIRPRRPSAALVVSTISLVVALGGTSYAAFTLPQNSVGTKQLRNGAVTLAKISHSVQASLKGDRGPQGIQGVQGIPGLKGDQGPAGPLLTTLPSGDTLTGAYDVHIAMTTTTYESQSSVISFQVPLASTTTGIVVPNGGSNPDPVHCSGTPNNPTAAPGYFCLYEAYSQNEYAGYPHIEDPVTLAYGTAGKLGVRVGILSAASGPGAVSGGSWAVTAP